MCWKEKKEETWNLSKIKIGKNSNITTGLDNSLRLVSTATYYRRWRMCRILWYLIENWISIRRSRGLFEKCDVWGSRIIASEERSLLQAIQSRNLDFISTSQLTYWSIDPNKLSDFLVFLHRRRIPHPRTNWVKLRFKLGPQRCKSNGKYRYYLVAKYAGWSGSGMSSIGLYATIYEYVWSRTWSTIIRRDIEIATWTAKIISSATCQTSAP